MLIQKTPRLKRSRALLEAMEPGTYCVHRSWGLGKITDYDERENRLIIDFKEGQKNHAMDPAFCVDKLTILDDSDILVKAQKDPQAVEDLVKNRPGDLIVGILEKAENQSATALEIETVLIRLMGAAKFKKWWTQAKKVLVKDPRVAVPTKRTEPFVLRDEPVDAEEEVLDEFFETKAPKKKIALAAKLLDLSVKYEDLKKNKSLPDFRSQLATSLANSLEDILKELATSLAETKQLNPGERLHGIWIRNDLARFIYKDDEAKVEQLEPKSADIILASGNLVHLADQVPSTHYARLVDLIKRTLPDQWEKIIFDLLKNSSGKLTSECINFLMQNELEAEITKTLERWLVEQNLKAPVLMWMLKNRASKRFQKMLKSLMTPRLLGAIFFAIDYEALQNATSRRIPLAELISDEQELIAELLADANYETAHDLAQTLILNQGFEDLSKKSLLARFIRLYPQIQEILSSERSRESVSSVPSDIIVSKESFEARKKEYELLITVKIPKNKEDIAEARAHGDLRENAEYKMARQEQDILLSQKNELETVINQARVTDFTEATLAKIGIGNVVELEQASTGQSTTYSILGAWDGDPENNILSYQTPLAKALLGKQIGETVDVDIDGHNETWTIKGIERWVDVHK